MNETTNTPRLHSRQSDRPQSTRVNTQARTRSGDRNHRNNRNYSRSKRKFSTFKVSQIFSIFYNLALLYLVFTLVQMNKETLAIKIFAINASLIAFGIVITLIEKIIANKKGNKGNNYRKRTNNNNRRRPQ